SRPTKRTGEVAGGQFQLNSPVADVPYIHDRIGESGDGRNADVVQQVIGFLIVIIKCDMESVIPKSQINTYVIAFGFFPFQLRIPKRSLCLSLYQFAVG